MLGTSAGGPVSATSTRFRSRCRACGATLPGSDAMQSSFKLAELCRRGDPAARCDAEAFERLCEASGTECLGCFTLIDTPSQ